jgi:uncharacterized protein YecE (DUF72 family)
MLKIGCAGWTALRPSDVGEENWRARFSHKLQLYALFFPIVEVNSTFYRLPRPQTAEKWRALADQVNPSFEFTAKVNQRVTHKAKFRGEEAVQAFLDSAKIAQLLRASTLLLQCPPSFGPSQENEAALRDFLARIDRKNFTIVWEPRGKWEGAKEKIAAISREFTLVHCTDPFRWLPVTHGPVAYLRLHGAPPGTRMYRYTYTEPDLRWLGELLEKLDAEIVYVLFNNDTMAQDALSFRRLWEER